MNEMSLNGQTGEERCNPSIEWLAKKAEKEWSQLRLGLSYSEITEPIVSLRYFSLIYENSSSSTNR